MIFFAILVNLPLVLSIQTEEITLSIDRVENKTLYFYGLLRTSFRKDNITILKSFLILIGQTEYVKNNIFTSLKYTSYIIRDFLILLIAIIFNIVLAYQLRKYFKLAMPNTITLRQTEIKNFKIVIIMSTISIVQHVYTFMVLTIYFLLIFVNLIIEPFLYFISVFLFHKPVKRSIYYIAYAIYCRNSEHGQTFTESFHHILL